MEKIVDRTHLIIKQLTDSLCYSLMARRALLWTTGGSPDIVDNGLIILARTYNEIEKNFKQ
jgi:hypothetical protein